MALRTSGKISWLIGIATAVCFEAINWQTNKIYWLAGSLVAFLLVIAGLFLVKHRWSYRIMVWLIPAVNFLAWCSLLTLINSSSARQVLIGVAVAGQWWYWWRGWPVWVDGQRPSAWWRVVNAMNLLSVWLLAAAFYGWQSFLAWPIWWLELLWLLFSGLLIWTDYRASDLSIKQHWPIMLTNWLLGGQLFLVVYFLPSSNLVLAYLMLAAYYLTSQVARTSLLKVNTAKRLRYQFLVLAICLIFVLLTAKWF